MTANTFNLSGSEYRIVYKTVTSNSLVYEKVSVLDESDWEIFSADNSRGTWNVGSLTQPQLNIEDLQNKCMIYLKAIAVIKALETKCYEDSQPPTAFSGGLSGII